MVRSRIDQNLGGTSAIVTKLLLEEIRNEYKKISRKNSEGNIKKK